MADPHATPARTRGGLRGRLGWADAVTALVTAATLAVTFLPWGRSGDRVRTSYELVDIVGPAGVLSQTHERIAAAWYLVPVLAALVVCCAFWGARRTAGGLLGSLGVSVSTFAHLVDRSPLLATTPCRAAFFVGTGAVVWGVGLLVRPRSIGSTSS